MWRHTFQNSPKPWLVQIVTPQYLSRRTAFFFLFFYFILFCFQLDGTHDIFISSISKQYRNVQYRLTIMIMMNMTSTTAHASMHINACIPRLIIYTVQIILIYLIQNGQHLILSESKQEFGGFWNVGYGTTKNRLRTLLAGSTAITGISIYSAYLLSLHMISVLQHLCSAGRSRLL